MPSPGKRSSIEEPPYIADVLYLKDELNRLHDNTSSECQEHIEKMTDLVDDFEKDYKSATRAMTGGEIAAGIGAVAILTGLVLAFVSAGTSLVVSGLGAAAAAAGGIAVAIGQFQKQQKEKNIRQKFEDHLTELQNKISPVIDVLQKLFDLTQKILRDPSISEHKANMIRERFSYCFDRMKLFQRNDNRGVTAPMSEAVQLTEHFSKFFTEMNSLLKILEKIIEGDIEDDKDKNKNTDNRPETSTRKQTDEKEFKEKSEKFIEEMRQGIKVLQNTMNEIEQIKTRISQRFDIF